MPLTPLSDCIFARPRRTRIKEFVGEESEQILLEVRCHIYTMCVSTHMSRPSQKHQKPGGSRGRSRTDAVQVFMQQSVLEFP